MSRVIDGSEGLHFVSRYVIAELDYVVAFCLSPEPTRLNGWPGSALREKPRSLRPLVTMGVDVTVPHCSLTTV